MVLTEPVMMQEEEKTGWSKEEERDSNGRGGGVAVDRVGIEDSILGNGGHKNLLPEGNRRK